MGRTRKPKASACPVEKYAKDVVGSKIVTGRLVQLACQRHLHDLATVESRGLTWDDAAARHAIEFFGHLRHSSGEWAGQPFKLQPWQQFVIGSLFGWKRADGVAATEDAATVHGTQKPVEVMRRPIVNNSARGDLVYEPFAGSGTTLIAAETVGRICMAIELDPPYCDIIVKRWEAFTGGTAECVR